MTEQKKVKLMGGAVLALAVVTLFGIAYAAFTQNLRINGSATTVATSWDIHFENLRPVDGENNVTGLINGTAKQLTAPAIDSNATTIENYSVSLTSPGDSISYIFDVRNAGDYNAKIASLGNIDEAGNIVTPVCKVNDDATNTNAVNVCKYLTYTLKYYDTTNNVATTAVSVDDTLTAGQTRTMILTLTYNDFSARELSADELAAIDSNLQSQYDAIDNNASLSADEKTARKNSLRTQAIQKTRADELPSVDVNVSGLGFAINYVQDGNSTKSN